MVKKINKPAGHWIDMSIVALAYFATGWFGLLFAIPPGYATVLWMPSGIALAAVLLKGNRVWPGIWIGSILTNVIGPPVVFTASSAIVAMSIAVGSTMQALLGATILTRYARSAHTLMSINNVVAFFFATLVMCFVASTFGVTSLSLAGFSTWTEFRTNWFTWYLGDAAGILLVTPLILAFYRRRMGWQLYGPVLTALVVLWSVWLTINGQGPFALETTARSLQALLTFVFSFVLTMLLAVAAWTESKSYGHHTS